MAYIRGALFYLILGLSIVVMTLLVLLTCPFTSAIWRYKKICAPWARFVLWTLKIVCGIRVKMKGMENMPPAQEHVVVLAKHQSAWDPFWLGAYLAAPTCYLYKKQLNYLPFLGWALWAMDMLSIDRQHGRSAFESFMHKGPEKLKQGWWICLFPEGTRVPPGQHVRYKTGGARFACSTGTKILPIAHNAGHCWPKNTIAKYPGTITVSVGELIPTAGREPHDVTDDVSQWIENELDRMDR